MGPMLGGQARFSLTGVQCPTLDLFSLGGQCLVSGYGVQLPTKRTRISNTT